MVDTHCHVLRGYYDNIDEVINNMNGYIINSGYDDNSNLEVIESVNKYINVYGVIGIQPEEINKMTDDTYNIIESNISNPKIVGIGEIGLDYHWDDSNKEEQKIVFKRMLDIAKKYNKPVVIHSRDAHQDTFDILKEYQGIKGVLHCYSGSLELAREYIKMGYMLGIGGVLTFKNSKKLVEIVKEIPLDCLLLETDSPYLAPEPFRGKTNYPNYIEHVAKKIAEIKDISYDEVLRITKDNAIRQFDLNI